MTIKRNGTVKTIVGNTRLVVGLNEENKQHYFNSIHQHNCHSASSAASYKKPYYS